MKSHFRGMTLISVALILFATSLVGWTTGAATGAAAEPQVFGIHDDHTWDVDNTRITSSMDAEAGIGSKVSRNTLRWNVAQPTPTTYDWSKTDFVVNEAAKRNMQVELVVRAAPQWANGSTNTAAIPSDTAGFNLFVVRYKAFFQAAVQRYAAKVKYWEVWTEPNEGFLWQPIGLNYQTDQARWIDMYAQLYKDTLTAVRLVNSTTDIALGAITGLGASCCILGPTFLNGLIDRGVTFDYVAINPHNLSMQAPWDCVQYLQSFCDIQKIRDVLTSRGLGAVRIWVTEFGWQAGGFTTSGTTTSVLRVPGDSSRLRLWPDAGQVVINGATMNYSSITRTSSYNDIHLTSPLSYTPALNTELASPQADATHASYVKAAIQMLRGRYVPQSGMPQQDYSYVQMGIYFDEFDEEFTYWGAYGLFHEPTPNYDTPLTWTLRPRPAAFVFADETSSK